MYLRFVIPTVDAESGRRQGFLVAAHELREERNLDSEEHSRLVELCAWFNEHLRVPPVLNDSESRRALSWFKPTAQKPIAIAWNLAHLLQDHGAPVEVLKTKDPGVVVYEDKWQVVAKPPRGLRLPW